MKEYKDAYDFLMNIDNDKNAEATILFKDFTHGPFTMNKSFLIKEADILAASVEKKSNSISLINALKLRWTICLPKNKKWDIKRCKTPIRDFVKELGLELWLDMDEVDDLRNVRFIEEDGVCKIVIKNLKAG